MFTDDGPSALVTQQPLYRQYRVAGEAANMWKIHMRFTFKGALPDDCIFNFGFGVVGGTTIHSINRDILTLANLDKAGKNGVTTELFTTAGPNDETRLFKMLYVYSVKDPEANHHHIVVVATLCTAKIQRDDVTCPFFGSLIAVSKDKTVFLKTEEFIVASKIKGLSIPQIKFAIAVSGREEQLQKMLDCKSFKTIDRFAIHDILYHNGKPNVQLVGIKSLKRKCGEGDLETPHATHKRQLIQS